MARPDPTPEEREHFFELYRSGLRRDEAAKAMNADAMEELITGGSLADDAEDLLRRDGRWFTGSLFRSLYRRDPSFAQAYDELHSEHDENFEERIRAEYVGRAMRGSDRLLDNLGQATLPELAKLRQSNVEHNIRVQIGRYFDLTQLSARACPHCGGDLDELDMLQVLVEKASKPKELPPAA